jgi:hypothetical protein
MLTKASYDPLDFSGWDISWHLGGTKIFQGPKNPNQIFQRHSWRTSGYHLTLSWDECAPNISPNDAVNAEFWSGEIRVRSSVDHLKNEKNVSRFFFVSIIPNELPAIISHCPEMNVRQISAGMVSWLQSCEPQKNQLSRFLWPLSGNLKKIAKSICFFYTFLE